jgi:hypothetical protein
MKIRKNGKVVRLTESDLQRIVKKVLSEGPQADRNVDLGEVLNSVTVVDGNGDDILKKTHRISVPTLVIQPSRFEDMEVIKITIPGLKCEEAYIGLEKSNIKTRCIGDTIKIVAGDLKKVRDMSNIMIRIVGNVSPDGNYIRLDMKDSTIKPSLSGPTEVNEYRRRYGRRR